MLGQSHHSESQLLENGFGVRELSFTAGQDSEVRERGSFVSLDTRSMIHTRRKGR
jgi:hypothetical protein